MLRGRTDGRREPGEPGEVLLADAGDGGDAAGVPEVETGGVRPGRRHDAAADPPAQVPTAGGVEAELLGQLGRGDEGGGRHGGLRSGTGGVSGRDMVDAQLSGCQPVVTAGGQGWEALPLFSRANTSAGRARGTEPAQTNRRAEAAGA